MFIIAVLQYRRVFHQQATRNGSMFRWWLRITQEINPEKLSREEILRNARHQMLFHFLVPRGTSQEKIWQNHRKLHDNPGYHKPHHVLKCYSVQSANVISVSPLYKQPHLSTISTPFQPTFNQDVKERGALTISLRNKNKTLIYLHAFWGNEGKKHKEEPRWSIKFQTMIKLICPQ